MNQPLEITLRTLTPLWTGGVDGTSDRLHATGIIGSLRWWYEAIVRGLGGRVSNPVAEEGDAVYRAEFDTKAYEKAKQEGKPPEEALQAGLRPLCAVTYLFGTTGWARLFKIQVLDAPTTSLYFVTNSSMNESWLKRVFGGESRNIDDYKVPYGRVRLQLVHRGYDAKYAVDQIVLAFQLATEYGGIGARLQHGFGQAELHLPTQVSEPSVDDSLRALRLRMKRWETIHIPDPSPFNLRYFVSQTYVVPDTKLHFRTVVGTTAVQKRDYFPCVFDLRYKDSKKMGMRRWLEEKKGWRSSDNPKQLGALDKLMGPRSQWGPKGEKQIDDDLRTAGRIFFGMPFRMQPNTYQLKVFGFAPPDLLSAENMEALCSEYMNYAFGVTPSRSVFGKNLLAPVGD